MLDKLEQHLYCKTWKEEELEYLDEYWQLHGKPCPCHPHHYMIFHLLESKTKSILFRPREWPKMPSHPVH